ncbi:hypothetical protein EGR_00268 [Echinococcus granulosus]|uniref:Uncharacterized protein n=2 Tax=Echinococcus granulosus TaxID=6210 RepID=W6VDZ1_ECHGR|nr:hypothetical protein EGR_00268 [Echinococcus granulosus]EUB64999.1 hypothetical protein EGR_00268 [Echinococcus granulosus]
MPLPTLLRVSFFYTLSYAPGPLLYSIFTSSTALRLISIGNHLATRQNQSNQPRVGEKALRGKMAFQLADHPIGKGQNLTRGEGERGGETVSSAQIK